MAATLPLYWNLSDPTKEQRIDASTKLVDALQQFQQTHTIPDISLTEAEASNDALDAQNAQDVAYALRRLIRGLASPRESSRLGFAVVLTELLHRLDTVSANQIVELILSSSQTTGSMNGQEERDMLFARLFGLTAVIESGLIARETAPVHASGPAATIQDYQRIINELVHLGSKKTWLRESSWWSILQAVSVLSASTVSFKSQALDWTFTELFVQNTEWTPEKIGLWLQYQPIWEKHDTSPLKVLFKGKHVLAPSSLQHLALILKDTEIEDEEGNKQASTGVWKPHAHFVWSILLDYYFSDESKIHPGISPFQDLFRVVVDEHMFSATSSSERKYTAFQVVDVALRKAPTSVTPHLFTKNFVRTWINQLAKKDRNLHKAALKLASTVQRVVKESPSTGFPLVIQLLGPDGSRDFDRLTNTKTVETILGHMQESQILEYVDFLKAIFQGSSERDDKALLESDRQWVVDQYGMLIRSTIVPKSDAWVTSILEFLIKNGFFYSRKAHKNKDGAELSDSARNACRLQLGQALADLSSQSVAQYREAKSSKFNGRSASGELWNLIAVKTFKNLGKDKDLRPVFDIEENAVRARTECWSLLKSLEQIKGPKASLAHGATLLLSCLLLQTYAPVSDDSEGDPVEALENSVANVTNLTRPFLESKKKGSKTNGATNSKMEGDSEKPIDLIVDELIGYLEKPGSLMRTAAPLVFADLCSEVEDSTLDLILMQLEQRNVLPDQDEAAEMDTEDGTEQDEEDNEQVADGSEDSASDDESNSSPEESDTEDADMEDVDPELRQKIAQALGELADDAESDSSDGSSVTALDDDQMMQLDEKLADVFRSQSLGNKAKIAAGLQREATHFKIRVLDFLEILIRKYPESPQIPRMILPLIRVVMGASTDEQQLIEKANAIIRRRIGVLQTLPKDAEIEKIEEDLEEVHKIARKASHQQISPATLTFANVYMCKILVHAGRIEVAARIHAESLDDFMHRKSSQIYHTFFADTIKRVPAVAWAIRRPLIQASADEQSVNLYRQMQAVHWLDAFLPLVLQTVGGDVEDVLPTMQLIREATYKSLFAAISGQRLLSVAQAKNVVKNALQAIRITSQVDASSTPRIWDTVQFERLFAALSGFPKLSKGGGLMALMQQMARKLGVEKVDHRGNATIKERKRKKREEREQAQQGPRKKKKKEQK